MIPARVAFLTSTIRPHMESFYGALGTRVRELRVFLSSPSTAELRSIEDAGFQVTVQKSLILPSPWVHPIGFADSMSVVLPYDTSRQLTKYRPDIIISGECGMRSVQSAIYCLRHARCPLVLLTNLSEHTEAGRGRLRGVTRRWLFKRASAVLVNGQSAQRYVERLGCDPDKVAKVPYTVPVTFKYDHAVPSYTQVRRLLYVGQLTERKAIMPFVESLGHYCTNNPTFPVELWIAGAGPLERRLKTQALGGRGTMRFLGSVSYENLPAIYKGADLFVFPTLADEWGVVVNEAMASGLPVLGSVYSQAVEELVEDGVTGWVFRPDHRDELMARLCQALSTSPERLAQMGRLAAERVSRVTPDAAAEQMVSAIAKLL